jgi:hypothetical protein
LVTLSRPFVSRVVDMKPQSCKNKGRRFQQKVAASIVEAFPHLTDEDVRSTSMGAGGEDILLSPLARRSLPLSIECKCVERINLWACIEQAVANCPAGAMPCLIASKNRTPAYAVLPWEVLLSLFAERRERGRAEGERHSDGVPPRLAELIREAARMVGEEPPPVTA